MENPIEELPGVVLSVTQEPNISRIFENIDKYFTEDAVLLYPVFSQIYTRNGRENLKPAYQWRQTFSFCNQVIFNATMVNKDQTDATIDLDQIITLRLLPLRAFQLHLNYIVRIGLRKCEHDGKYRIYRQQDNFPTDITQSGVPVPGFVRVINDATKAFAWLFVVCIGHILMMFN